MPPDGDGDDGDDDGHGHAHEHKTWDAGRTDGRTDASDGRTKETEEENKQLGSAVGRSVAGGDGATAANPVTTAEAADTQTDRARILLPSKIETDTGTDRDRICYPGICAKGRPCLL